MEERLYIENTFIPLSDSLNPTLNKSITNLSEPQKRNTAFSRTVNIPRSNEADKLFSQIFELNLTNLSFDVNAKADVRYEVGTDTILEGYFKLNAINVTDFEDIVYEGTMFSSAGDFMSDLSNSFLTDLYISAGAYEGLDVYDHQLTKEIQAFSWDTQVWYDGAFIPFAYGTGYVYPLIDYGLSSNHTDFAFTQIGCAIYAREYILRMIDYHGYTYTSSFLDSTFFKHLIIPSSPECYQLDDSDIENREFSANTPQLDSTGTTTSGNLPDGNYSPIDQIIFTNEIADTGGVYDNTTGVYTVINTGVYDLTALIDVNATFTPATANAVKTQCEVDGFIEIRHTPLSTGVEVLIGQLPFYITHYDSSFVSGARSTSSTPTYPDVDYLNAKHYSIYPNDTSLTGRAVEPPDRYQCAVNAVPLAAGDEIRVYYKAGLFHKGSSSLISPFDQDYFVDSIGTTYSGTATITISVGAFYNKVANSILSEGNTLYMSKVIPKNVKQIDFFTSILKMFNLWIDVDPLEPTNLLIETRDDYLGTDELNIHELIDRSKPITHIPMGVLDAKRFLYKYKEDSDYWNTVYKQSWNEIYGNREVYADSDFYTQDKSTEVIFSPTTLVAQPNSTLVLPTITQFDELGNPKTTKHNIRILYYAGLKPTINAWNHINYVSVFSIPLVTTYVEYPYAGHLDDPYDPTLDINWGIVKEVYYDDNINDINYTDNNLVNAYHAKQLREITDPESRIVKAYVRLNPSDYNNFTFDKLYFFDYAWFRLQSIENYAPISEETTLCTFLKLNDASVFNPTIIPVTGNPQPITPDQTGGGVILREDSPAKTKSVAYQGDGNVSQTKQAIINGENNYVGNKAKYVEITGSGNKVFDETTNIKIQGDNNIVQAGLENVTIINTSDLTVTESNVTYINGKLLNGWITKSSTFVVDDTIYGYNIDGSSSVIQIRLNNTESEFYIKVIDATNRVYLDAGTKTFDNSGVSEYDLLTDESIRVRWNADAGVYNIIN